MVTSTYVDLYVQNILEQLKIPGVLTFFEEYTKYPIVADRFGYLNKFSSFDLIGSYGMNHLTEIKQNYCNDDTRKYLYDNIYNRISNILSYDGNIYVMWSGGIDSTTILVSILMTKNHYDNITVVLSDESIEEYPLFYEKYIKNNFSVLKTTKDNYIEVYNYIADNGLIITGDCGDQLYNSHLGDAIDYWNENWIDYINFYYENTGLSNIVINQIKRMLIAYDMNIVKTHDLIWWLNFICRWDYVKNSFDYIIRKKSNSIAFYDDISFETYSLNIPHNIHPSNIVEHKKDLKYFIYDYTKDDFILNFKGKGRSHKARKIPDEIYFSYITDNNEMKSYYIFDKTDNFTEISYEKINSVIKPILKDKWKFLVENNINYAANSFFNIF